MKRNSHPSRFYDYSIRPNASGDGAISFTRVGRLVKDEPGFGAADTLCATGEIVTVADLTPEVLAKALRSDSAENWLVHEDASGVKLFQRVTRVGTDCVEVRGKRYRYSGAGADAALYEVGEAGETQDRSERVNVVMGFVANESAYALMKPLAGVIGINNAG